MLIYEISNKKIFKFFFVLTDGRTDRQTHQKYSSEYHKTQKLKKVIFI